LRDETSPRALWVPDWLQTEFGRRATGLTVALLLELLLLLALLSLSWSAEPPEETQFTEVDLSAQDYAEPQPAPEPEQPQPRQESEPTPQPIEPVVPVLQPQPTPAIVIPLPEAPPAPKPEATPPPPRRPGVVLGPAQGPPNTGKSPTSDDSQRVGTAPNGEPLYAARWYREPGEEIRGFFSDASPGTGVIACRTVPNFYVTDCVALGETPGSMLNRSMLAASGNFRVRPAQIGGRVLVGSWVRIRYVLTVRRE
jgi:protein TonB